MSAKEVEPESKFKLRAYLVYMMLLCGLISVTVLTFSGKVTADTYEKIGIALLTYVAGFASAKGTNIGD